MEENTEAKLKSWLKQEKIQLWNPPYTEEQNQPGVQHLQVLAERYAPLLGLSVSEVGGALENVRVQAVTRGKRNQTFRETNVATLELLLPRDARKDPKSKTYLETKLDVLVQDLLDRIGEEFGLKSIKLILNGKTLSPDQRLEQQAVRNHSKMMVLRVSDSELKEEEEKRKNNDESLRRTQKGFQILSERDGSEESSPFLEIADQRGNPLKIPHQEKKALILAMGLHEKGRSLMKRKSYDVALSHLLQADQHFSVCGSALLGCVDNFWVLQLDIVWCYRALEALGCLEDGRRRLQRAEDGFTSCYGEERRRLLTIQGSSGREEVLFLRLHLLQSLLSYLEGNDSQARLQLDKVDFLFSRLQLDSEKMQQLQTLGFSERESRLGLRACEGDLEQAVRHITSHRQEQQEVQQREQQRRRRRKEEISTLTELGFSRRDAARALHHAEGDLDKAYAILLDSSQASQSTNNNVEGAVDQLLYLGFERGVAQAALRLTGGDVQTATQLLLDHQGVLPPDLLVPDPQDPQSPDLDQSPSSEEPSTSSSLAEDSELVNEVLEDIPGHEEDYLDLDLEEETRLIKTMKTYLDRGHTHTV